MAALKNFIARDPTVDEARHAELLAGFPAIYKTNHERLAAELALHIRPPQDIFPDYGYTPDQSLALLEDPAFQSLLTKVEKELSEHGTSYRMKARGIAEELLPEAYSIAVDREISASVRADVIQWITRVAGLEPPKVQEDKGGGGGMTLNITFAGQEKQKLVTSEPLTIEGGA